MHSEARAFVARHACDRALQALDIGGRNVNGSCRDLFGGASWTVLDRLPGEGVDLVANVITWQPGERRWDLVLCTEVLEHERGWRTLLYRAREVCAPGGELLLTCAGPGRPPHSGIHGGALELGEHYRPLTRDELELWLDRAGWRDVQVQENQDAHDIYARAVA